MTKDQIFEGMMKALAPVIEEVADDLYRGLEAAYDTKELVHTIFELKNQVANLKVRLEE